MGKLQLQTRGTLLPQMKLLVYLTAVLRLNKDSLDGIKTRNGITGPKVVAKSLEMNFLI